MATKRTADKTTVQTGDVNDVTTTENTQSTSQEEVAMDTTQTNQLAKFDTIPTDNSIAEEVIETKQSANLREQLELAKELNLTVRTDTTTGEPILPSTPAMRAAAARRKVSVVMPDDTLDIEQYVSEKYGDDALKDANINLVVSTLAKYVKRMSPSASINEIDGGEMQSQLADMYDVVLSLKPELSQICLGIIVTVVKRNIRGAFTERLALRFANTMPVDKERAIRFQLLTTLFIQLASGTAKKDLAKVINIRQLLEYITARDAKANLSEFIN